MLFFNHVKKLRKALRFLDVYKSFSDSEIDDLIRIQRIKLGFIGGVLFVYRAISPTDLIRNAVRFTTYTDEKSQKIETNAARVAEKNQKLTLEREQQFREQVESIFETAILSPDPVRFPITDYYNNPEIFLGLYAAIMDNSGTKKKAK